MNQRVRDRRKVIVGNFEKKKKFHNINQKEFDDVAG